MFPQFLTSSGSLKPQLEISRANLSFPGRGNSGSSYFFPACPVLVSDTLLKFRPDIYLHMDLPRCQTVSNTSFEDAQIIQRLSPQWDHILLQRERLFMLLPCPILFYFLRLSQKIKVWEFLDFGELENLGTQIKKSSLDSLSLEDSFLCYWIFLARVIENILFSIKI